MKMISKNVVPNRKLVGIKSAIVFAAVMMVTQVNAATPSQCKGLENSTCSNANSCSWVEGYERKDGRKVSSFCRTKAKSKSTSATQSTSNNKAS